MELTPETILNRLRECGFAPAAKPYHGDWRHCRRESAGARIDASIDLATGRLRVWGTRLEYGPDEWPGVYGPAAREPRPPAPPAFVRECMAAGFEILCGPDPVSGNYQARHGGEWFYLIVAVRQILGVGFREFGLHRFRPPTATAATAHSGRAAQRGLFGTTQSVSECD